MSLRDLAASATPGRWEVDACDGALDVRAPEHKTATIWIHVAGPWTMGAEDKSEVKQRALADARLIALAPEMAVLLTDMADTLTEITDRFIPGIDTHEDTNAEELLARFRDLDNTALSPTRGDK